MRRLTIEERELLREAIEAYCSRALPSDMTAQANERRRRKILRDLGDDLRVHDVSIAA